MHGKKKKFHLSTTISARLRPSFLTTTAALSVIFTISPVKLSTQSILIMPGSSAGRTAVLIIPSRGGFFFFLILYFLCFFQGNGNNFLLSLSLRPFSLSRRWNVKPLFWGVFVVFFFYSYRSVRCWKPFDPQSRVLLTDWCFHTVTLAELPVFGGPRCHSGTNALEFSQIIPLCTCLCGTMVNRNGKHLSLYLSVSLRGLAFN